MARLSPPSRVASILDWNKTTAHTVLAVNFHKNRVGIAVASHPSRGVPCRELEPLRFGDSSKSTNNGGATTPARSRGGIAGAVDGACLERFSKIIEEHMVCGVVVNWPLQRHTGRMGAACGRVAFALEQLWARSNEPSSSPASIMAPAARTRGVADTPHTSSKDTDKPDGEGLLSRPFCLWDAGRTHRADSSKHIDAFGRCASYGKDKEPSTSLSLFETTRPLLCNADKSSSTSTTITTTNQCFYNEHNYFAGREQYYEDEHTVVLGVWEDFCREHWPDLRYSTSAAAAATLSGNHEPTRDHSPGLSRAIGKTIQKNKTKKKRSLVTMR